MSEATTSIDLAQPRVIVLAGPAGRKYILTCRRVAREDWEAFFDAVESTATQDGKDQVRTFDYDTPRRILAERVITSIRGYLLAGDQKLDEVEGWQSKLPLAHRLAVGAVLASARLSAADEGLLSFDTETVTIDATWSGDGSSTMQHVTGLKHHLNHPSEEQHRRYARESSRSRILGGDRAGTTVYPGAQRVLAQLYDELVFTVEGYTLNGEPLRGTLDIRREMDMHHKFIAAQQVFQPQAAAIS